MYSGYTWKLWSQKAKFSALPLTTCVPLDKFKLPQAPVSSSVKMGTVAVPLVWLRMRVPLRVVPGTLAAPGASGYCYKATAITSLFPLLPKHKAEQSDQKKSRDTATAGKSRHPSVREAVMEPSTQWKTLQLLRTGSMY